MYKVVGIRLSASKLYIYIWKFIYIPLYQSLDVTQKMRLLKRISYRIFSIEMEEIDEILAYLWSNIGIFHFQFSTKYWRLLGVSIWRRNIENVWFQYQEIDFYRCRLQICNIKLQHVRIRQSFWYVSWTSNKLVSEILVNEKHALHTALTSKTFRPKWIYKQSRGN